MWREILVLVVAGGFVENGKWVVKQYITTN
jgi:hypothetical protein